MGIYFGLIEFPKLDKKAVLIIIFITYSCITYLINKYIICGIVPYENQLLDKICQFLIYIPIFIFIGIKKIKHSDEEEESLLIKKIDNNKKSKNFTRKDKMILIIMIIVDMINDNLYTIFDERINPSSGNFVWINIMIIFMLIFSHFYSREIFYKHKLLSLFIIIILTSIIDVVKIVRNKDEYKLNTKNVIIIVVVTIIDAVVICYKHYILENKNLRIEKVSSLFGFFIFLGIIILMIMQYYIGDSIFFNEHPDFVNFGYKTLKDWGKIIFSFIVNSIDFFWYFKILKEFSPFHVNLCYIVCRYLPNLEDSYNNNNKTLLLIIFSIFFIIVFFCFLVFLEIMELNFCNLNFYTRRNILQREQKEKEDLIIGIEDDILSSENKKTKKPANCSSLLEQGEYYFDLNVLEPIYKEKSSLEEFN